MGGLTGDAGGFADPVPSGAAFTLGDDRGFHDPVRAVLETQGASQQVTRSDLRPDGNASVGVLDELAEFHGESQAWLVPRGEAYWTLGGGGRCPLRSFCHAVRVALTFRMLWLP
ncbi:hypothetical protein ADK87_06525 [Streptomyces sp. NRRL F-4711]|nr:hypothetical protein ADK87_06525 [Streptomyces sp. NRRL F-4711]